MMPTAMANNSPTHILHRRFSLDHGFGAERRSRLSCWRYANADGECTNGEYAGDLPHGVFSGCGAEYFRHQF
jgi:hypothetical protein